MELAIAILKFIGGSAGLYLLFQHHKATKRVYILEEAIEELTKVNAMDAMLIHGLQAKNMKALGWKEKYKGMWEHDGHKTQSYTKGDSTIDYTYSKEGKITIDAEVGAFDIKELDHESFECLDYLLEKHTYKVNE